MSLLLTKNCHYAILVAIEDGQHFIAQEDKDVYIASRLNLKLPRPVDDLIPPTTLISTKPTILTDKPQWRTTLVYYVSSQILHRLRKRQAQVTLEVNTLAEKGARDILGSIVLKMEDAKMVILNGKRDISQIQQFVVDKGDWLSVNENNRSQVKAGLFIAEMPQNTDAVEKKFGTPLQRPIRTDYGRSDGEVGLEICSDVSELLINMSDNSILLNAEDEDDDELLDDSDYEQVHHHEEEQEQEEEQEEEEQTIAIGNGLDQYSFEFRIIDAKYISSITKSFPNIVQAFFQYEFADKQYQCPAENDKDTWLALENHPGISIQGHLEDIKTWMEELSMITVCLIGQDSDGKQELIGFSEVYIKGRDIGVVPLSTLIYDCDKTWHINSSKQFSKLQVQVGLTEGWNDEDE
ncbi:hypothetical protein BDF21DRAFT_421041 [Thamnidium elegans]|nr:hypothetical protein BDF21DRAFT_421041 [Thamnidium elegans]